ncbi:MAG: CoA transferase [Dehalococcoidia bacterium]|jgi:crotonobetainyl-CoA:carnitine CoA-transferase CaiB-like acyl-CoA transferase|nr:CoA transferase [Dehalococcoidia bacterium]
MTTPPTDAPAPPPLDGVRIIEVASIAAAFAGRQLAELGAEVILVEPPEGAPTRHRYPYLASEHGIERSLHHLHYNQGKRSLVLDLDAPEDAATFRRLAASADAVLEAEPVGSMDERGIGFEALRATNSGLLYATVTPFGQEGPLADYRGNDLIGAATSGLMYLNGYPEDPPNVPGADQANHMGAIATVATLLTALVGRDRDNRGGHRIDGSVQEAASISTLQTANANIYHWHQRIPARVGLAPGLSARSLYPCQDGAWISFTVPVGAPALWPNFTGWLEEEGIIDTAEETRWLDPVIRQEHPEMIAAAVGELCSRYPRRHIFIDGQRRRMLTMPVNDARDLTELDQLLERDFFATAHVPQLDTELTDVGPCYRFSETPPNRGMRAPALGEHTDEILASLPDEPSEPAPQLHGGGDSSEVYRPLEGIRVVDFFWMLAGPLTSRVLANYGADILKIESESRPDTIRITGVQPTEPGSINTNGVFGDANVGKRSLAINLKNPRGIELIKELVAHADIVTNNYTPDRMDLWGLGYEDLRKVKSDIIMLTMPVMGMNGPYQAFGSYGNGIIAYSGLSQNMGFSDRPPTGIAPLYSDFAAPYFAVSALMSALHRRERTGEGQFIELAQSEAGINLLGPNILEVTANNQLPPRIGNRSRNAVPHGAYPCAGNDRWLAIACESDDDWRHLATALGHPDLVEDPRYATLDARRASEDELDALIADWTRERDTWDAMHYLQSAGVIAGVVEDLEDNVTRDPHLSGHHLVPLQRDDEQYSFLTHSEPVRVDGHLAPMRRAPQMGEHTSEILREVLGFTDTDIASLVADGVLN